MFWIQAKMTKAVWSSSLCSKCPNQLKKQSKDRPWYEICKQVKSAWSSLPSNENNFAEETGGKIMKIHLEISPKCSRADGKVAPHSAPIFLSNIQNKYSIISKGIGETGSDVTLPAKRKEDDQRSLPWRRKFGESRLISQGVQAPCAQFMLWQGLNKPISKYGGLSIEFLDQVLAFNEREDEPWKLPLNRHFVQKPLTQSRWPHGRGYGAGC